MIDWHSHILPAVDDGSRDVKESIALLKMLSEQGVDTVIATPHFYANDESVDEFLERRKAAYEKLSAQLPEDAPAIRLGTEVRYYPGICRLENLKELRIEGTQLLLLEMPMSEWTDYTVRELLELSSAKGITLVLAHIERYLPLQRKTVWETLTQNGVLMQVNASFFTELRTKRKAISMLKRGEIHFIGSDCHNLSSRPPEIGSAFEIIRKSLGDEFLSYVKDGMMITVKEDGTVEVE